MVLLSSWTGQIHPESPHQRRDIWLRHLKIDKNSFWAEEENHIGERGNLNDRMERNEKSCGLFRSSRLVVGMPGWLSLLSIWLLISTHVLISGSWVQAPWGQAQCGVYEKKKKRKEKRGQKRREEKRKEKKGKEKNKHSRWSACLEYKMCTGNCQDVRWEADTKARNSTKALDLGL